MTTAYKGTNKLITGIVFGVLTFWLFAQAMVNVVPAVQKDLGVSSGTLSIAISLSALFSGIFIVAAGGLADKIGRKKINQYWTHFKYRGFTLFSFSKWFNITHYWSDHSRSLGSLYYASNDWLGESLF